MTTPRPPLPFIMYEWTIGGKNPTSYHLEIALSIVHNDEEETQDERTAAPELELEAVTS